MRARSDRPPGLRAVWARPSYRRLWVARTVSQVGDVAQFTTVALLVLTLTGSGIGLSALALVEIAPVVLLAPIAGALADRYPRVKVMVAADLARVVMAATLTVWHDQVAVVYLVAFGLSAGATFFNPAAGSLLPSLVEDDELVAANSGIWSAAVLSQVALAPVVGLTAMTAGFGWAFALNTASFALSALALRGLSVGGEPAEPAATSVWRQGLQAMGVVVGDPLLRALAVAQALAALSAGATSALLVLLAADRLEGGGGAYGAMIAAIGTGAFLGPLVLRRLTVRLSGPAVIFGAFGVRGFLDLVLATVTALPLALGALVLYGLGTSTGSVSFSSLIQSHVPAHLRGRVFSAFDVIWQSMRLLSLVLGGVLAEAFGIRAVYYAGGVLLLAAASTGWRAGTRRPARP